MVMTSEDWVRVAMNDDWLVAETLLLLHQTVPPPPETVVESALKLEWSVRQRRSKTVAAPPRKKRDPTRASPTTPLSWSGATSVSGAGEGFEESSGPQRPAESIRSKVSVASGTAPFKKSRRKKTLAELKDEESLLLRERRSLKNELANLRLMAEKQRVRNEILKKMKVDSLSQGLMKPASASLSAFDDNLTASCHASSESKEGQNKERLFLLPDLNMPFDNDLVP